MSPTLIFFFLAVLTGGVVAILWIGFARVRASVGSTEHTLRLTQPQRVHELLSSIPHEQIRARSIPNERLVRAFKITNTFVSDSVDVHSTFTREARALLRAAGSKPGDWSRFADGVKTAIETYLAHTDNCHNEYEPFVQYVTFTAILTSLFGIDIYPSPEDVLVVTQGINDLWRLSKTSKDIHPKMLETINAHLRVWIPAYPNPLNFILPTFETMWRVVAVTVALAHKDGDMRQAFSRFIADPTGDQFERFEGNAPSASAVIAETMRLHPPTRRIHRASVVAHTLPSWITRLIPSVLAIPTSIRHTRINIIAEIGTIHRDSDIWGDDADVFRPQRHHPDALTAEQRGAFMPFGYGKLKCVASGWAPHAAGMIVGEVLRGIEETYALCEGGQVGGRAGWDGWKVEVIASD